MHRQSEKNFLNTNNSSTCPDNMVNFGLLTAEICWRVWGTPANFNGFRVLAALRHSTLVVGVSQTAALNRGRHLYSAGRPSRWALAHISSSSLCASMKQTFGSRYFTATVTLSRNVSTLLPPVYDNEMRPCYLDHSHLVNSSCLGIGNHHDQSTYRYQI